MQTASQLCGPVLTLHTTKIWQTGSRKTSIWMRLQVPEMKIHLNSIVQKQENVCLALER